MHPLAPAQVADLEPGRLADPQPARIDQAQHRQKPVLAHDREQPRDLLAGEHQGQRERGRRTHQVEQLPVAAKGQTEVGAHRRDRGAHRRRRIMVRVLEVEQMGAQLRLVDAGGIAADARRQFAHVTQVFLLRGAREAAQFEQFREADQRFRIGGNHASVAPFGGCMGRHGPSSLAPPSARHHAPTPCAPPAPRPRHSAAAQRLGSTSYRCQFGCRSCLLRARVAPAGARGSS